MSQHAPLLTQNGHGSTADGVVSRMRSLAKDYKTLAIPAAGNISASYNICNIGYVVQLIRLEHPVPRWAAPAFSSSCLCGAVVGQISLGWVGDRFGRRVGLIVCLALTIFGSLGSAMFTTGYGDDIWNKLVWWRFLLGVGVGGTYPLSAVYAGEMADDRGLGRTSRVAYSIASQIIGNILAPLLLFIVVLLLGCDTVTDEEWASDIGWRFLLAMGAVPSALALREVLSAGETADYISVKAGGGGGGLSEFLKAFGEIKYRRRLLGASLGWFSFDVCFFGVAIFLPHIMHSIMDKNDLGREMLLLNSIISALINALAIPAALLSVQLVVDEALGRKKLQILSFVLIATSYFILYFSFPSLRDMKASTAVVILFAMLFFALNFGAGLTTYILPQESFPRNVRASFNGVAAASGKLGAILGASCFAPLTREYGLATTFFWCGIVALVGASVTTFLVDDMRAQDDAPEVPEAPAVQRHL